MAKHLESLHKKLVSRLDYDPVTGVFTWRESGQRAGTLTLQSGRYIKFNGRKWRSARLAWFHCTGKVPVGVVRHWDGVKDNDSWLNLQHVTPAKIKAGLVRYSN